MVNKELSHRFLEHLKANLNNLKLNSKEIKIVTKIKKFIEIIFEYFPNLLISI